MLSRRSLFTRLSAVALAPFVKLLPKAEEPAHIAGNGIAIPTGKWVTFGFIWDPKIGKPTYYLDGCEVEADWINSGHREDGVCILETKMRILPAISSES